MSRDWQSKIMGLNESEAPPHNEHAPSYHACETYDLDALEGAFVRSDIYQRFAYIGCTDEERARGGRGAECAKRAQVAHAIGSVSGLPSEFLNGTYCSAYARALANGTAQVFRSSTNNESLFRSR